MLKHRNKPLLANYSTVQLLYLCQNIYPFSMFSASIYQAISISVLKGYSLRVFAKYSRLPYNMFINRH